MSDSIADEETGQKHKHRWLLCLAISLHFLMQNFSDAGPIMGNIQAEANKTHQGFSNFISNFSPGGVFVPPIVAWLVFVNFATFRKLAISSAVLLLLSYILILINLFKSKSIPLDLITNEIGNISNAISLPIMSHFALTWFPVNQVGLTIGLLSTGTSFGKCLSLLAQMDFIRSTTSNLSIPNTFMNSNNSEFNLNFANSDNIRVSTKKSAFTLVAVLFTSFSLIILVLFCVFIHDLSSHSPKLFQKQEKIKKKAEEKSKLGNFFNETKKLLSGFIFVFHGLAFSFIYHSNFTESRLLLHFISSLLQSKYQNSEAVISHVIVLYTTGSILGSVISGRLLDGYQRHRSQASVSAAFAFIFSLLILLGCYLHSIIAVYIGMFMFGFFCQASLIPLLDSILQHHHPTNSMFLTSWLSFLHNMVGIAFIQAGLVLFRRLGPASVLTFQAASIFVSFIFSLSRNPDLKRSDNDSAEMKWSENDKLLQPD